MIMILEIRNELSEKIDYWFAKGNAHFSDWIVLLGHGVTGNRSRPVIALTAKELNQAGFSVLTFSFSGNGESEGDFRESCISKGVEDLKAVMDAVGSKKIAYIGHSMGAAIGVLSAARDNRIRCLVSLAGMVDTRKFAETEFGGEIPEQSCMWEEESCPLSQAFMTDLCEIVGSVIKATDRVKVPWLLLHGSVDDVVLPQDSEVVKERLGDRVDHFVIAGADHSFNNHRQQQLEEVVNWLKKQCS